MAPQRRKVHAQRWPLALAGLTAVLGALSACAKIVGIEETTVTRTEGSGGDQNPGAGAAGEVHAGSSSAGRSNGGSSSGGGAASAGAET